MIIHTTTAHDSTVEIHADGDDTCHCTIGEPVTISADPAITQIALDDQPGGTGAMVTTSEITCEELGAHRFAVSFADGSVGALRLVAHERA